MDKDIQIFQIRDKAKHQLEQIRKVDEGVAYLNKLSGLEAWVKAEKMDAELQNMVAEQKLRTQRILGNLIIQGQKKGEIATKGENQSNLVTGGNKVKKTLPDLGLTAKQSQIFKQIANIPEKTFEAYIQEKKQAVTDAVAELTTAGMIRACKDSGLSTLERINKELADVRQVKEWGKVVKGKYKPQELKTIFKFMEDNNPELLSKIITDKTLLGTAKRYSGIA